MEKMMKRMKDDSKEAGESSLKTQNPLTQQKTKISRLNYR
jgi:hypothetical protein